MPYFCIDCKKMIAKKWVFTTLSKFINIPMISVILISAVLLIILILLQVRDGGLNVTTSSTLQAPIERRGPAKTLHIATILVGIVFVGGCVVSFLS